MSDGQIIRWTDVPNAIDNGPANAALLDYIDAALQSALNHRDGKLSVEAYEERKQRMRQEFNNRLLQILGAK